MSPKPPLAGEVLSSSQWFQPVAAELEQLTAPQAGGIIAPSAQPGSEPGAGVESGVIVAEQVNTITVTKDRDGVTVTVAKPPNLRGNVATRINSDGDTEEIFPSYHPGVRVLIASVTETGVSGVTFADLSWGARRWTIEV